MNPRAAGPDGGGNGSEGARRYRFGDFVVDEAAHTLLRAGAELQVEPKAFAVLLVLLRHAGELVEHETLLDQVWGHRHVTPGVLTRAIAQLRSALGDDSHDPRYIQTQHAMGYRFIAALDSGGAPEAEAPEPAGPDSDAPASTANAPAAPGQPGDGEAVDATGPAAAGPAVRRRFGRRGRLLVASAMLAIVAAGIVWWRLDRTPKPQLPAEPSIAVLPFTTLSDNQDDRYFAEGLAVEMHDALAGVPGIKVAATASPGVAPKGAQFDVRKLGKTLGVATVLDASVRREGTHVRVNARLSDTRSGYTLWAHSYDRELSDVFDVQSEIAGEVVQSLLGVLPGQGKSLARRLAPTRNVAAYDAYLKGLDELQDSAAGDNLVRAIDFFNDALAADPRFARAQAGICRAEIQRFESARDAAAYSRAQQACQHAAEMDPRLREVSLAMGDLYRVRGDSAKAIEQYTRALEDPALAADADIGIARTHSANGRPKLALEYLERALQLRPGDGYIYREIGYLQYMNDNFDQAIAAYRRATELQPMDAKAWSGLGAMYLVAGDKRAAADAFQRSLKIEPTYGALGNLALIRYEAGEYVEAERLYRKAAAMKPQDYRNWGNIGDALAAQPEGAAAARAMYRRALELVEPYIDIKSDDAQALASSAWYSANLGENAAARDLLTRAEALGTERGEVALWAAQTLALLGDDAQARAHIARARSEGIDEARIAAAPVLKPLLLGGLAGAPRELRIR